MDRERQRDATMLRVAVGLLRGLCMRYSLMRKDLSLKFLYQNVLVSVDKCVPQ
jgi:hypothetical protein